MLVQVACALQLRGLPQHVVSLRGRGENARLLEAGGVEVTDLGLAGLVGLPGALLNLRRVIARLQPTVIQGWMYHGNIMSVLGHRIAPGRSERRVFWGLRASDMDGRRYGGINWMSARLSHWPDVVVANSESGARFHERLGYRPRVLKVVPNGIDCDRFRPDEHVRIAVRTELGLPTDAIVVIHVARVDPMKDHENFLRAMQKNPAVTGLLIGRETDKLMLPANVRALGERRDVQRLYCAADIIVSSSAFGEGFSNVLAEGMAAGLVPIATRVGDADKIIGSTGRIVPVQNPDALAAAIREEAAVSREDRALRGMVARKRIKTHFTIENAVSNFERLYSA